MRLDKFLKVSRIIKRRSVAKDTIDAGFVLINDKNAKACSEVKVNDILTINNKGNKQKYRIVKVLEHATEAIANTMYERVE